MLVLRGQHAGHEAWKDQLAAGSKSDKFKPQKEAAALPTSHSSRRLTCLFQYWTSAQHHPNAIVMENTFDKTAVETIDLLEARLRRIEYAVCGQVNESALSSNKTSAAQRLAALEHSLHQLASKSRVVQELLRLRKFLATNPIPV